LANVCPTPIFACLARATRLNATTGATIGGADGGAVTDGMVTIQFTPDIEEGTESILKNGCGRILAQSKTPDRMKRWNMVLTMGEWNPAFVEILTGHTPVLDGADLIGIIGKDEFADDFEESLAALEIWAEAYEGDAPDSNRPYFYGLITASTWRIGDFTLGEEAATVPLNGFSRTNSQWGNGPYDDTGISDQVRTWMFASTDQPGPEASCGYIAVTAGS
jgi:hypothetical protein